MTEDHANVTFYHVKSGSSVKQTYKTDTITTETNEHNEQKR
jgi:hypothetical protein